MKKGKYKVILSWKKLLIKNISKKNNGKNISQIIFEKENVFKINQCDTIFALLVLFDKNRYRDRQ